MKEPAKYLLISQQIQQMIEMGEYKPNDQLPKEYDLAKAYNVSRITIRGALQDLENKGLIYRIQGAGTFVKEKEIAIHDVKGNIEPLNLEKYKLKLLNFEVLQASNMIQKKLNMSKNDIVYIINRLAIENKQTVAFQKIYMPAKIIHGLDMNMLESSIYPLIQEKIGIDIKKAIRNISLTRQYADISDEFITNNDIENNEPLLKCEQTSYLANDMCFEYSETYYRISRFPIKEVIIV